MRTIVDIPENQIKALDLLGKKEDLSRAELVRRAVKTYLDIEQQNKSAGGLDKHFGFLKDDLQPFDGLDALEYERKMRAEWDQRDEMYSNWGMNEKPVPPYTHEKDKEKPE